MSWLRVENFGNLKQHLKTQKLNTFLELLGKVYPDLVKMFYVNLKFNNGILKTSIKGLEMEITRQTWKDMVGLRQRGVQVRKGETIVVDEFNKVQYFNQCVRNQGEQTRNFHMGRLCVEEMLLAMVVTKIIMPRGSNHATLNEGDLVVMYCIQNDVMVDWTYTIRDHMMKAMRLKDFKLPYVVLISKFIEHFGVDVEGELEESTSLLNHVSTLNMQKMGFTKIGNTWLIERDHGANIEVGANDHEAGTSGGNQGEDEPQAMAIELYNPLENIGPAYSQFERMVLNQLQDLNMAQNAHHA